jgi:hypothetical protein
VLFLKGFPGIGGYFLIVYFFVTDIFLCVCFVIAVLKRLKQVASICAMR